MPFWAHGPTLGSGIRASGFFGELFMIELRQVFGRLARRQPATPEGNGVVMTDIRYVILSDLHFGAENSVLTALNERPASADDTGFSVDPQRPSPLLSGLVDGLRELTRGQDRPPTLILAGDILDLALSFDAECAMVFRLFAHLAFSDGSPAFDPVIHYVPGNHDHHEWEITRENQYVTYVCGQSANAQLAGPWHTTKLEPDAENPLAGSALLTGLARKAGSAGVKVEVSYPNLALRTANGRRCL